jgi:hypothetical protein
VGKAGELVLPRNSCINTCYEILLSYQPCQYQLETSILETGSAKGMGFICCESLKSYTFACFDVGVVLGFGVVWFYRLMPTFQRNVLSPSSFSEVAKLGSGGLV